MKTVRLFFSKFFLAKRDVFTFLAGIFFGIIGGVFALSFLVPEAPKMIKLYKDQSALLKKMKNNNITAAHVLGRNLTSQSDYIETVFEYHKELKQLALEALKLPLEPAIKTYIENKVIEETSQLETLTKISKGLK